MVCASFSSCVTYLTKNNKKTTQISACMTEWDYIDFLTHETTEYKDHIVAAALSAQLGQYLFSLPMRSVGGVELCTDEDIMSALKMLLQQINSVKMFKKTSKILTIGSQTVAKMSAQHRILRDRFGVRVDRNSRKYAPSLQGVIDEVQGIMAGLAITQRAASYSYNVCRVCMKRLKKGSIKRCARCGQVYCSRECQVINRLHVKNRTFCIRGSSFENVLKKGSSFAKPVYPARGHESSM